MNSAPAFSYCNDALCAEAIPLAEIAEEMATPFYVTSAEGIRRNVHGLFAPFSGAEVRLDYALRAKPDLAIVHLLALAGAGAEVSSAGELERALEGGIRPERIVLAGFRKNKDDLLAALISGVDRITVETPSELVMIGEIAAVLGRAAPVSLRVDLAALEETAGQKTGLGFDLEQLSEAVRLIWSTPSFAFKGFSVRARPHLQSGLALRKAYKRLADITSLFRAQGLLVERLDLGSVPPEGETGVSFAQRAAFVEELLAPLGCVLSFTAGRRLVGEASALVARVLHVKKTAEGQSAVLEAGTGDLLYPAADAACEILPLRAGCSAPLSSDVIGPSGEAKDVFGARVLLPPLAVGDAVAILQSCSLKNALPTAAPRLAVPEVLVSGARHAVIRRRMAVAEQMEWEPLPEWMGVERAA